MVNPWVQFPDLALTLLEEASARRNVKLDDPRAEVVARTPEGQHPPVGAARIEAAFGLLNARDLLNALHFKDAPDPDAPRIRRRRRQLIGGARGSRPWSTRGCGKLNIRRF